MPAAARILDCDGGAITLAYTHVERVTLSATDDTALALEEAQDVMGQGPGHDAFSTGAYARFDLLDVDGPDPRWPMLESNALTALAPLVVHALPMGQGEDRVIGVLTLYQRGTDRSIDLDAALIVARVLAAALLADEPTVHHTAEGPWSERAEVHQATGMVVAQLGVPEERRARPAPGPRLLARPEPGPQRPRGARAPPHLRAQPRPGDRVHMTRLTVSEVLAGANAAIVGPDLDVTGALASLLTGVTGALPADAAAVLVTTEGSLEVLAATSHRVADLEVYQAQVDEGPCLDAMHTGAGGARGRRGRARRALAGGRPGHRALRVPVRAGDPADVARRGLRRAQRLPRRSPSGSRTSRWSAAPSRMP